MKFGLVLLFVLSIARLGDSSKWSRPMEVPLEPVLVFALDAGPRLDSHVFSTVAALSSVVHFSENPESLRFVLLLTIPAEALERLSEVICVTLESAIGQFFDKDADIPNCRKVYFSETPLGRNETESERSCKPKPDGLDARVTLVQFPIIAREYPYEVSELFELFCCSQRRYSMSRPELARSLGNHARFHAHVTLLSLGVQRALFLDADVLARVDISALFASPLTKVRFIAAARRCAQKRAKYQPHFKFQDELVQSYGLRGNALLINAGVLVVDLEAYCNTRLLDAIKIILRKHVAGPPLWRDGNNQPPFTIAAARHITYVDPAWNVRLGDAKGQMMMNRAHSRAHKKKGVQHRPQANSKEEECIRMLDEPYILHAHFNPCHALPERLCPTTSNNDDHTLPNATSNLIGKAGLTIPRLLKLAVVKTRNIASRDNKVADPCRCAHVKRLTPPIHRRRRGRHRSRHSSSKSSSSSSHNDHHRHSSTDDDQNERGGDDEQDEYNDDRSDADSSEEGVREDAENNHDENKKWRRI